MSADLARIFDDLCRTLGVDEGQHGEAVLPRCPSCGKESTRRDIHATFSVRGWHCFVCGEGGGLFSLARRLNVSATSAYPARPVTQPPKERYNIATRVNMEALVRGYEAHAARLACWQAYSPVFDQHMIQENRLGVGAFPEFSSQCAHERLQVPLIEDGKIVGLRGRAFSCTCKKWLSPGGSRMILYLGDRLLANAPVDKVLIVENPVDALLLWQHKRPAVATLGVTIWGEHYSQILKRAGVRTVGICYDNDRPGNGGGEAGRLAWLEKHNCDIVPNGVKLANRLLSAGFRATIFSWEGFPLGADPGMLLRKG
jgi:hypothetical protein